MAVASARASHPPLPLDARPGHVHGALLLLLCNCMLIASECKLIARPGHVHGALLLLLDTPINSHSMLIASLIIFLSMLIACRLRMDCG